MNKLETDNIQVDVKTAYIEEQSNPDNNRYVFAYTINIQNHGQRTAQLLNRHWVITDANGKIQEVRGKGVIGEQPKLRPGESFEYTSGAILETPVGAMEGEYEMLADDGDQFLALITAFSLSIPNIRH